MNYEVIPLRFRRKLFLRDMRVSEVNSLTNSLLFAGKKVG